MGTHPRSPAEPHSGVGPIREPKLALSPLLEKGLFEEAEPGQMGLKMFSEDTDRSLVVPNH